MRGLWYCLFGWWIRWQACKLAAVVVQGWAERPGEGIAPSIWSAAVFFESYMLDGAAGTREEFGPKAPVELKPVTEVASGQ